MNKLRLYFRGEMYGEYALGTRPLAVGRGQQCDIVIHDPEVAEHHLLVVEQHGTIVAYDLTPKQYPKAVKHHFPLDQSLPLGKDYSLRRVIDARTDKEQSIPRRTKLIKTSEVGTNGLSLVVGRGRNMIRYEIHAKPMVIGSAKDCDIVIADRAVDDRHCRLEPSADGIVLRDLGSLNGTFLNCVKVMTALMAEGMKLSVGHTHMRMVRANSSGVSQMAGLVAKSSVMLDLFSDIKHYSKLSWPVLILGESGTGKEHIARALHDCGPRRKNAFVAINAGGLPETLVESELFGHERGAFTGATSRHKGVFEQANSGTLFIDEIGELPIELQARLLRVMETQKIRRVGSETEISLDVRVVCATHRDIRSMIAKNNFRSDLFYRLTRLIIEVPPLRSRQEDIPILVEHFLHQIIDEVGFRYITNDAVSRIAAHYWSGNARELFNVLSFACAVTASQQIDVADIEFAIRRIAGNRASKSLSVQLLQQAVQDHNGNQAAAARALGIARSTLRDRLKLSASRGTEATNT